MITVDNSTKVHSRSSSPAFGNAMLQAVPFSHPKKGLGRTDINIKTIRLKSDLSFPKQLKTIRELMGISLNEMADRLQLAPSNVHHFENQNKTNRKNPFASVKNNITETALKYAKALGATKIEILL